MDLTLGVTMAVLAAGFLHAGWNALLKSSDGGDVLLDTAAVVAGSSVCGLALLAFVPLPDPAAWKFIAASATIHFGYYLTLVQAYRTGDLSFAYPLMRGTAPLLVTILGTIVLRELPSAQQLLAEKVMFRDLERAYAGSHIERLTSNTAQSIETSSLHLDLISDLKRINSHICSIAYPILEQAGVLAKTRLKEPAPASPSDATASAAGDKPGWQKRKPHTV